MGYILQDQPLHPIPKHLLWNPLPKLARSVLTRSPYLTPCPFHQLDRNLVTIKATAGDVFYIILRVVVLAELPFLSFFSRSTSSTTTVVTVSH
jgi:hypothetical protein